MLKLIIIILDAIHSKWILLFGQIIIIIIIYIETNAFNDNDIKILYFGRCPKIMPLRRRHLAKCEMNSVRCRHGNLFVFRCHFCQLCKAIEREKESGEHIEYTIHEPWAMTMQFIIVSMLKLLPPQCTPFWCIFCKIFTFRTNENKSKNIVEWALSTTQIYAYNLGFGIHLLFGYEFNLQRKGS